MPSQKDNRCSWLLGNDLHIRCHDEERGVPSHGDGHLSEMLILDGAQAGLSWLTILKKRDNHRRAFDNFDAKRIARYARKDVDRLSKDVGIMRNHLRITPSIVNSQATLVVQKEFGGLDVFPWQFVNGRPVKNRRCATSDIPSLTSEPEAMSRALSKRRFQFVGFTICHAFMQAVGIVNDHVVNCPRYRQLA